MVAGVANGRPVFLRDVADVRDGGEEPSQYVEFGSSKSFHPAVTIAVSKRKGANAIDVAGDVLESCGRAERHRHSLRRRAVDVTRQLRRDRRGEIERTSVPHGHRRHLGQRADRARRSACASRGSCSLAIPVTLALTLTVFYLYGYTLNRITLFALIFSIGILVDDAIVVVENIVRHCAPAREPRDVARRDRRRAPSTRSAIPTILATLTVIAAILPMAFVSGLMGPYMRPIPIGATAAMVFSLVVAFFVTPWAAVRLLKPQRRRP